MSTCPHPYTIELAARLRQEELLTQCGRDRLSRLATSPRGTDRRQRWPEQLTAAAAVLALALVLALVLALLADTAVAKRAAIQTQQAEHGLARGAERVLAENTPHESAAHEVRRAAR
jgi:hypothetical protein